MFSEEEIKEFKEDGLTDDQIAILQDAMALKDTIDLLPDDIESFIKEYESKIPKDAIEGMRATFELAQKDPAFFRKIVALDMVLATGVEEAPKIEQNETIVTKLSPDEYKKASKNFFKTIASLSDNERKQFLKLIAGLTEEQKEDMVSRLVKE